jgi:hypothetical protein
MICHHYKCLFVHLPKNAGQSVEHVFIRLLGLTWETRAPLLLRRNDRPELGPPRLSHLKAVEYLRCKYMSPEQFDTYFKFAFVRNPWDRMVSMYKWHGYHQICSFKTFVGREFHNELWRHKHWFVCPQTEYLCDEEGRLLVDFVGRYEQLQKDFHHVCEQMGLPATDVPHVNANKTGKNQANSNVTRELKKVASYPWWLIRGKSLSKSKDYRDYYDEESKELVAQIYRSDIELFGYEFEGAKRPAAPRPVHA